MIGPRLTAGGAPRSRTAAEIRLFLLVLSGAIPAVLGFLWAWAAGTARQPASYLLAVGSVLWITFLAFQVRGQILRHIRTLNNLVEGVRVQDYSMKAARARDVGELGALYKQLNELMHDLSASRQGEQELLGILEKVVDEIGVAIFVFDPRDDIRLVNRFGCTLLNASTDELVGTHLAASALAELPAATEPQLIDFRFPGAEGRWQVRQHFYHQQGRKSRILFIADMKQILSHQETLAWRRLIRVISHEVNNSLTPISSLCQTLSVMLSSELADANTDVREGLGIIAERAKGLREFISVYASLARMPEPQRSLFRTGELVERLRRIFAGQALEIMPFSEVTLYGDSVHLEQALINLIKNALEATPCSGPVELHCQAFPDRFEFQVADRGPGISNIENLFVPFYTTKQGGAGIGLVLCRQIATQHHGDVVLENRRNGTGALARLILPLPPREATS